MFLKSELLTCGQKVPISWRWLSEARCGFLMMKNRSLTHSLQTFVTGLNGCALSRIFQFTLHVDPLDLHSQMCVLRTVSCLKSYMSYMYKVSPWDLTTCARVFTYDISPRNYFVSIFLAILMTESLSATLSCEQAHHIAKIAYG